MRPKHCLATLVIVESISFAPCLAQQALDIEMHPAKTSILLGEPIWVDVAVTNKSTTPLSIGMGANCFGNRPLKAEILGAEPGVPQNERRCYQGFGGSCPSSGPSLLEPGDTLRRRYVVAGDFRIVGPGSYHVLLKKTVIHAIVPPGEKSSWLMANFVDQSEKGQFLLNVEPADPHKLLALEQSLAIEVTKPFVPQPLPMRPRALPSDPEALRKTKEARDESAREALELQSALAEGLAEYPAAGMEPVFNQWMISGEVYYGRKALYNLNTPNARQMLAQAADPSQDLYLRWRQHRALAPGQKKEVIQEAFENWRAQAIHALARMGDRSYLPLLEKLAGDSSAEVREEAILSLGLLGGEAELPKLVDLVRNGATANDRESAMEALGDTTSLKAVPILIELFSLPNANEPISSNGPLMTLTHHLLPAGRQPTAAECQTMWQEWWEQNKDKARAYGPFECADK